MEISFPGRRVLVTGAVRGIGRAIALAFAAEGAEVHATDIDDRGLTGIAAASSHPVQTHALDVTDSQAIADLVGRIGPVDIAVHAAGGVVGQPTVALDEVSDADWRAIQAVNVDGAFYMTRAVAPGMKASGGGRIVVISSGAGLRVSRTGIHSYGTAKTAQIGLVRQLASELGPFGITVNTVAPGYMPQTSPDYRPRWEAMGPAEQTRVVEGIAMRRLGEPEDIANAVLFLSSDRADWITGIALPVMGGP